MAKLTYSSGGQPQEWVLVPNQPITIGRDVECQIRINDPAVSRHHARLVCLYDEWFVEDLRSTNGTFVNQSRIMKQILNHQDMLRIGDQELRFVDETQPEEEEDANRTVRIKPSSRVASPKPPLAEHTVAPASTATTPPPAPVTTPSQAPTVTPGTTGNLVASVEFLSGPSQGTRQVVNKALFTIGQAGSNLAVISRRVQAYHLLHLGGEELATVNSVPVHGKGILLTDGDVIVVGGCKLIFRLVAS
ncbi:putative FHA domain-containing protein [Gammaproteobacteria bacterium]